MGEWTCRSSYFGYTFIFLLAQIRLVPFFFFFFFFGSKPLPITLRVTVRTYVVVLLSRPHWGRTIAHGVYGENANQWCDRQIEICSYSCTRQDLSSEYVDEWWRKKYGRPSSNPTQNGPSSAGRPDSRRDLDRPCL